MDQPLIGEYRKVEPKRYAPTTQGETVEGTFWRSFRRQATEPLVGNVTSIDFCPVSPFHFAVTNSTRVTVYSGVTREPLRNFSRFKGVAYSGRFRSDGKLLAAGGDQGIVQVFDGINRTLLRQLKGHTDSVRSVLFSLDKVHLMSAGDDKCLRWWDIGNTEPLRKLSGHSDYVRSLSTSPVSSDLWASGSYDHSVRIWDMRVRDPVMVFRHPHPVEDVLFYPSGSLMAIAGGPQVAIWDLVKGGASRLAVEAQTNLSRTADSAAAAAGAQSLLAEAEGQRQHQQHPHQPSSSSPHAPQPLFVLANHQKTVTCLQITPPISLGGANRPFPPRLLTGSLDGHVRVFSMSDYKVKHMAQYGGPILSLGVSRKGNTLAVGMASGQLAIRHRRLANRDERSLQLAAAPGPRLLTGQQQRRRHRGGRRHQQQQVLRAGNMRYFVRGQTEEAAAEDYLVAQKKKLHLARHDNLLKTFQYAEALTAAIASAKFSKPEILISVLEELVALGGLGTAVARLSTASLVRLVQLSRRLVTDPRHASFLLPIVHMVLDLRTQHLGISKELDQAVTALFQVVATEARTIQSLIELQGVLSPLLIASTASAADGGGEDGMGADYHN